MAVVSPYCDEWYEIVHCQTGTTLVYCLKIPFCGFLLHDCCGFTVQRLSENFFLQLLDFVALAYRCGLIKPHVWLSTLRKASVCLGERKSRGQHKVFPVLNRSVYRYATKGGYRKLQWRDPERIFKTRHS